MSSPPSRVRLSEKELRFSNSLKKDDESPIIFCFNVLAQLTNILVRNTSYELLLLSKSTKEALRKELVEFKTFLTQMPGHSHAVKTAFSPRDKVGPIFSLEDMQVKNIEE